MHGCVSYAGVVRHRPARSARRDGAPRTGGSGGGRAPAACLALVVAAALAVAAAGCGSSGRELRAPAGFVAAETRYVPVNQSQGPGGMLVEGADFEPGGDLPLAATIAGEPPTLAWWNIPAGTTELVLLVSAFDPTEPPILWAVTGLGPSSAGLFGGPLPQGARPLWRTDGTVDWPGYPPAGTRVVFTLCAVATPLLPDAVAADAWNLCAGDALGVATVSGIVPELPP